MEENTTMKFTSLYILPNVNKKEKFRRWPRRDKYGCHFGNKLLFSGWLF